MFYWCKLDKNIYHSTVHPDGTVTAEHHNPAIPLAMLMEIVEWKESGATMDDVVNRQRLRTVPPGYTPHPWTSG